MNHNSQDSGQLQKVTQNDDEQEDSQISSLQCMPESHPQMETGQIPSDDFNKFLQEYCADRIDSEDSGLMDLEQDDAEGGAFTLDRTQNTIYSAQQREPTTIPRHILKQV